MWCTSLLQYVLRAGKLPNQMWIALPNRSHTSTSEALPQPRCARFTHRACRTTCCNALPQPASLKLLTALTFVGHPNRRWHRNHLRPATQWSTLLPFYAAVPPSGQHCQPYHEAVHLWLAAAPKLRMDPATAPAYEPCKAPAHCNTHNRYSFNCCALGGVQKTGIWIKPSKPRVYKE